MSTSAALATERECFSPAAGTIPAVRSVNRPLQIILVLVIVAAGIGLPLDGEVPVGLALAGIALMVAWWRFKLPPP